MKNRILAIFMASVLGTAMMTGCGGGKSDSSSSAPAAETKATEAPAAESKEEEAEEEAQTMLEVYREFSENVLAIPMFTGRHWSTGNTASVPPSACSNQASALS